MSRVPILAAFLLLAGCQGAAQPPAADAGPRLIVVEPARLPFDGRVVPTNATDLHAPQNFFKVGGWQSDSSWIKLVDLVAEGTEVQPGDVVARFEFRGKEALPRIREEINRVRANRDKAVIDLEAELRTLNATREQLDIASQRARLDTLKEGAVAARQLALYGIEHAIARFEAAAVRERVAMQRRHADATRVWHEQEVARAESQLERFRAFEVRFQLRAPHAGVVRHAFMPHERRKVKKGDGMASGRHVISIARDTRLSVRFYVPEHRIEEVRMGQAVRARALASETDYPATVTRIERFPQEMGFLLEDERRPDAREKAFVVTADLTGDTGELAAGNETKVTLVP